LARAGLTHNDLSYMHVRWAAASAVALLVVFSARRAPGWQEAHQSGDDVHIVVDSTGVASIRHQLHWHIVRGPLARIDLVNLEPSVDLDPVVSITAEDGRALQGKAERRDQRTVRIVVAEPHALMRGDFTFDVGWRIDLLAARALWRDGASWRLAVTAPAAHDGFDNGRTVLDLPSAPTEPHAILAETGVVDESAVATLQRGPQRDILELVRPHVARGEAATWTVRLDPRALAVAVDTATKTQTETKAPPEPNRVRDIVTAGAAAALGMLLALLVRHKASTFARVCSTRGARARGLLPMPEGVRAPLAGAALAVGILLQVEGQTTGGAACVALAMLASTLRATRTASPVRGPGRWRTLQPEAVFMRSPDPPIAPLLASRAWTATNWLDIDSRAGRAIALLALALAATTVMVVGRFDPESAWLAGIDAAALLPLFATGRTSQLPPQGIRSTALWLSRVFRALRGTANIQVTTRARIGPDGLVADEFRLFIVPQMAMPGVVGLEVGLAWSSTPVCWAATPEVLARVVEGSAAALKLAHDVPGMRSTPGRRPDERVVRLLPRNPTPSSTVALVRRLSEALTDRRSMPWASAWTGSEKRAELSGLVVRSLAGLEGACLEPPCTL
jgi:hypothetical protein